MTKSEFATAVAIVIDGLTHEECPMIDFNGASMEGEDVDTAIQYLTDLFDISVELNPTLEKVPFDTREFFSMD